MQIDSLTPSVPAAPLTPALHAPSGLRRFTSEFWPLLTLAVPLIAGLTTSTMLGLVDTYMLGPVGEAALGAASLTASVMLIMYAALYGFLGPTGILIGQAYGAGDLARIGALLRHGRLLGLMSGVGGFVIMQGALAVLPATGQPAPVMAIIGPYWLAMSAALIPYSVQLVYKQKFDAINRPWIGFGFSLIAVLLNVPLNWLLIGGNLGFPALGLLGAGVASLTAQVIALIFIILFYRFSPMTRRFREADTAQPRYQWATFRQYLREGVPMGVQYLLEGGSLTVAGVMIGWLGATALAANQIVFSVGGVLYMLPMGMAGAVSIRIAQVEGAAEYRRIGPVSTVALVVVASWALLFTGVLLLAGRSIAGAFVNDPAIITLAAAMFGVTGLMQVFDGTQSVSLGALRGLLDNRWPMVVSLVGYWLMGLPASYVLAFPLGLGAPGIWMGFGIGLLFATFMLIPRLRKQIRLRVAGSITPVAAHG